MTGRHFFNSTSIVTDLDSVFQEIRARNESLIRSEQIEFRRRKGRKLKNNLVNRGIAPRKSNIESGSSDGTAESETTTTEAPPTSDDNFFSSYGGDIEYFFPLISFGIPFDGEITFLGFHGFKGLFPY